VSRRPEALRHGRFINIRDHIAATLNQKRCLVAPARLFEGLRELDAGSAVDSHGGSLVRGGRVSAPLRGAKNQPLRLEWRSDNPRSALSGHEARQECGLYRPLASGIS
jgi:hypothetical protein